MTTQRRFKTFFIILIILSLTVLIRYGFIMLTPSPGRSTIKFPEMERGPILDRNGKLLILTANFNNIKPDVYHYTVY